MDEHRLLLDLIAILAASTLVVVVLHRLRLPAVAGLLIAGALIGPSGLGWISAGSDVERLAEIGVVLLLFTIGLEFSLSSLKRIARMVCVGGALQVTLSVAATYALSRGAGLSPERAWFAGFLVALSSTAIVLRSLSERGEVDAPHGKLIVGVLLFQDLCVVPMMLVTPMLAEGDASLPAVGLALGKALVVMSATVVLARFVLPRIFRAVARTQRRDVFLLTVLGACASIAWATSLAGLSLSLGAFLAGMVLADSEYGHQALADVLPLRDLFTSLFFVSIGMLIDFDVLREHWLAVSSLSLALLVGKFGVATLAGVVMRMPLRVAALSGAALAQIGEFSFVLARLGRELELLDAQELALFLDASVITMLVTPLVSLAGPLIAAGAGRLDRIDTWVGAREPSSAPRERLDGHTIVLGYGVGGELLARTLRSAGLRYVLIDLDVDRVKLAGERGETIAFGDASRPELLEQAAVAAAAQVVVLLNDPQATIAAVRAVRRLAPAIPVIARARFLADAGALRAAGATHVVAQEVEASLHVTAAALDRHGLPAEEIEQHLAAARSSLGAD